VAGPNNTTFYATTVDNISVATTKEAPFHLRIVEPKVPLVQAGSMRLEIVADRAPSFDEPIEVQMVWNPPGVSSQSEATIAKGATNVFYQLNASGDAETKNWKIALLGHANVEEVPCMFFDSIKPFGSCLTFPDRENRNPLAEPRESAKLTVNLQQAKPFEGKAAIRLLGLPEHVTAGEKEITRGRPGSGL